MFSFFLFCSHSVIYTVDAGSGGIRVGIASNENGVGLQPSSKGLKETPNLFGYLTEKNKNETVERLVFGHNAEIARSRNQSKSIENPFSYLLNRTGYPFSELHPSIASALSIRNIVQSITQKDQLILTVPSFSSPQYRSMVHEIGQISGFTDVEVIDQSTALAALYAAEKLNKTKKETKKVLFVDISKTRTEITEWLMSCVHNRLNLTLNNYRYTDKVSGEKIDVAFADLINKKLTKKIENENELMKLAKKAKELISFNNTEDQITFDIIHINESVVITKEEVREAIKEDIDSLYEILNEFKDAPNVEVAGAASSFFAFGEAINSTFEDAEVSFKYVSVDSIALGAAYYGALCSKIIPGYKLIISRPTVYDYFVNKGGKEVKLLSGGSFFIRKFFNVLENDKFEFALAAKLPEALYSKVDVEEAKKASGQYTIVTVDGFEKLKIQDKMLLNVTLLPTRGYGEFVAMRVSGKNRKMQFDISERTPIPELAVPGNAFTIMKKETEQIKKSATQNIPLKLELETLLIEAKEKLLFDSTVAIVCEKEEIEESLKFVEDNFALLATAKKKKLKKMNTFASLRLGQIIQKAEEFKERPFAAATLQDAIDHIESRIPFSTSDEGIVQQIRESVESAKEYLKKATSIDRYSSPIIFCKDLRRRAETLLSKETDLFNGNRASRYDSSGL